MWCSRTQFSRHSTTLGNWIPGCFIFDMLSLLCEWTFISPAWVVFQCFSPWCPQWVDTKSPVSWWSNVFCKVASCSSATMFPNKLPLDSFEFHHLVERCYFKSLVIQETWQKRSRSQQWACCWPKTNMTYTEPSWPNSRALHTKMLCPVST